LAVRPALRARRHGWARRRKDVEGAAATWFSSTPAREGRPRCSTLALLDAHYRSDRDWTDHLLDRAQARLAHWRQAVAAPVAPAAEPVLATVRRQLSNDLDTVGALSTVDRWAHETIPSRRRCAAPGLVRDVVDGCSASRSDPYATG